MSETLQRIKSILLPSLLSSEECSEGPEIGFKILHNINTNELIIKVIAARNLPTCYGNNKLQGYLVKVIHRFSNKINLSGKCNCIIIIEEIAAVKVFPGREKYECETNNSKNSNPCFNQEFKFTLPSHATDKFLGRFVTFTVYAVLEESQHRTKLKSHSSFRQHIENFLNIDSVQLRTNKQEKLSQQRFSLNNRRTVGVVTYNLEKDIFSQQLKNQLKATPDIWRTLQNVSSGMQVESRESKKGCLEVIMSYSNSEDGKNDLIQVSLSKFRCSMQTMQQHEKHGGDLYLKMAIYEYDVLVGKWKGNTFNPTISMKIEPNSASMIATINNYNLNQIKIVIKMKNKNLVGKKILLGEIIISKDSNIWKQVIESPMIPITSMIDFM